MNPNITPRGVKNPFTHFCMTIGAIPTSYKNALDYYETVLWLIKFLENTVIPAVDNNAAALTELQGLFVTLKDYVEHYFDNLDVQEEINNKLDQMASDGTLQEIIADYLNTKAVFGFDNVASMKEATNLIDGSFARTLGYYEVNDGGGALYKIRIVTTGDLGNPTIISISDSLVAELIIKNGILPVEQCGIVGLENATDNLQDLIDYAITNNLELEFPNKTINIESIDFKNCKAKFNKTYFNILTGENNGIKITNPYKGAVFSNFTVKGNNNNTGIELSGCQNILLSNIIVDSNKIGIKAEDGYELTIKDTLIRNRIDVVNGVGLLVNLDDSIFSNIIIQEFRTGMRISTVGQSNYYDKIHIWSTIETIVQNSVGIRAYRNGNFRDCVFDTCLIGLYVEHQGRIVLNNCRWFYNSNYINDTVVGSSDVLMIKFDEQESAEKFYFYHCYVTKPDQLTTVKFYNSYATNWKGISDIYYQLDGASSILEVPKGNRRALSTPSSITDVTNIIMATESGVTIDYVGQINPSATTGTVTLGNLDYYWLRPYSALNTFAVYGTQWDAPEGFVYLYINNNGDVQIKVTNDMLGKYIKIHLVYTR